MSKYFDRFPVITYNGQPAKNLLARARFSNNTKNDPTSFVPYRMSDSVHRADQLAKAYYDDFYYDWLYYFSNEIVDPYHDVFKDDQTFLDYITAKYGSLERSRDTIVGYRNNWANDDSTLSIAQYEALAVPIKKYYNPNTDYYNNILNYSRKQADWMVSTNMIKTLQVSAVDSANFVVGDIFVQSYNSVYVAKAELVSIDAINDTLTFKNVSGAFVSTVGNYIFGKYGSAGSYAVSAVISPAPDNIDDTEKVFWSALSGYDYQKELNEDRRNIQLLRSSLRGNADAELSKVMRI